MSTKTTKHPRQGLRFYLAGLLLLGLFAGCVAPAPAVAPTNETAASTETVEAEATETETTETEESTEATGDAEATVITECAEGFRLFDHQYLASEPVCIPQDPQRIAMVWSFNVTALLRAGAPIVGLHEKEFLIGQFPEWEAELSAITDLGDPPNIEQILALEPDLIITSAFYAQAEKPATPNDKIEINEIYSSIAPVVAFQWTGTHTWREVAELIFDAAGKKDAYAALVAEEAARSAELNTLLDSPEETELSIVNVRAEQIYLYTQYSPGGMVVEEVGFARPQVQRLPVTPEEYNADRSAYPDFGAAYLSGISLELIDRAAGDFILVFGEFRTDDAAQANLDKILDTPLWQTLDAVKNGDVYVSGVNYAGGDIGNAHFMIDDLADAFGVLDQLSPNPYVTKAELPAP